MLSGCRQDSLYLWQQFSLRKHPREKQLDADLHGFLGARKLQREARAHAAIETLPALSQNVRNPRLQCAFSLIRQFKGYTITKLKKSLGRSRRFKSDCFLMAKAGYGRGVLFKKAQWRRANHDPRIALALHFS
jgi:hypothetical protein